jgi:integrase
MKKYDFKSVFASHIKSFLKMKAAAGIGTLNHEKILKEFDIFCMENNIKDLIITNSLILDWEKTRVNDSRKTLYGKYCILSQFCRYMCHTGYACYVPRLPGRSFANFIPYIFTHEQIQLFFSICDSMVMNYRGKDCILFSLPALFRLLYSTGLRISEAISLKNSDIDFTHQYIVIRKTKNQQQRLAPLNASMLETMQQYKVARDKMPLEGTANPDSFFFISPSGRPLPAKSVYGWFRVILRKCGIPHLGNKKGPRVHDFRHTCAVHSLMKQVRLGIDIYCALPVLSVFLGHRKIRGTEKYIRLTQEMYPEIIKLEQSLTSFVFPSQPVIEIDYEK